MRLLTTLFEKDKVLKAKVLENGIPKDQLQEYLLRNYSIYDLAALTAELIQETYRYTQPIVLPEADYNKLLSLFRMRGIRADGKYETRGNKSRVLMKAEEQDIFNK